MPHHAIVRELCISPHNVKKSGMQAVQQVLAIAGLGLEGDRYCNNEGSYQKKSEVGKRQVTLMDTWAFQWSTMKFIKTRCNILVDCFGFDLNRLINKPAFPLGGAWLRVVDYCFPCGVPGEDFADEFHGNGGVIAEVLNGGIINIGDTLTPPWTLAA